MSSVMTRPVEDDRLVQEAQRGSPDAFQTIVELYHERLYHVVLRIVPDRADAEEVLQETFLRAFRNLNRFHADSALYTWLYRIAVNAAVDLAKKNQRRRHLSLEDEDASYEALAQAEGPIPVEQMEHQEMLGFIREGIEALPERYRVILCLREYGDLSYEELMEVLELPKGTVESRLFRARAKLRDWLVRRVGEDGLEQFAGRSSWEGTK